MGFKRTGSMMVRKVCIVLTTRGNYAKMKSTIREIDADPRLKLQLVVAGGILLDRYGEYCTHIENDGFTIAERVRFLVDGDSSESMAMSAGLATLNLSQTFARLRPDIVLVIADRYESLSVAHAAMCMNINIAHLEGGEISGSIDERIRHAITKLSHLHFPASHEAAERIKNMGESKDSIITTGTPSLDLISELDFADTRLLKEFLDVHGFGDEIDIGDDYLVVSQHSVVTESTDSIDQMSATLNAITKIQMPVVWILPNMDVGESSAAAVLSTKNSNLKVRKIVSIPMELYALLLKNSQCLVGNSSSGIRECAYLGVPVVNIGTRQNGRKRGANVLDVSYEQSAIEVAINMQLKKGSFRKETLYGDGSAGKKIVAALASFPFSLDKRMTY